MSVWEDVVSQESTVAAFTATTQVARQTAQQHEVQAAADLVPEGARDEGAGSAVAAVTGLAMTHV